jgi:hypothetical protein
MLLDFESQLGFANAGNIEFDGDGIINGRQTIGKLDVDDRPDDLHDFAIVHFVNQPLPKR